MPRQSCDEDTATTYAESELYENETHLLNLLDARVGERDGS